ncbi:hypothetical protein FDO65_01975 [Nakamurella flava]|uniref:Serine/threonine protein kinase n=1 Tax=Nakamurella flava TaxID=2576308 RepID=A0A4U6QJ83_9ACTN|nr:hypothetical protein [Nakamurella flava]TKV60500.1 hypothetical protein FDO65_01975 [Nakamurella flava]
MKIGTCAAVVMVAAVGLTACAAPTRPAATSSPAPASSSSTPAAATTPSPAAPTTPSPVSSSAVPSIAPTTVVPTDFGSAECYFAAESLGDPVGMDNGIGVGFGFKEGTQADGEPYDNTLTTESYLDACRQSLTRNGHDPGDAPLAACVLPDGRIAVAPGDESICGAKGLAVAQPSASGPIPNGS